MRHLVLVLAIIASATAGCSKADDRTGGSTATTHDGLVESWKTAGLTPSALTAATVAFGKDCKSGTVNNIDVIVCTYGSAAEAKAAEPAALEWVGGATGSSWSKGSVLVAVADRRKADPSGRTINQLMKL